MARSVLFLMPVLLPALLSAAEPTKLDTSRGDRMFAAYFERETAQLRDDCLAQVKSAEDWNTKKVEYRRELFEMLGLDPLPEKTDLHPTVTGTTEHDDFVVEKMHFQSRPGLYVTANLYRPKKVDRPLPAILYVCGHGQVKKNGISYGNKVHYQHHAAWFARNGFVCLVLDTLQLGEIEGFHHGTHRLGMWWWLNRGYTPAGVEAWNCIRALDYLEMRPEVDKERFGVTGRSGGGAYSWWIAALDERIKCAVPGAGITDLENHVVDGVVEGHCDCMFMVNTFRWDYPQVAALVAPRPLLISNTDTDPIFPLDGVMRTFDKVRRVYRLVGAGEKCGVNITAGGHVDTQELQVPAFRWFNQHLKQDVAPIEKVATKFFEPEQLRVFQELPADQKNTQIQETFVTLAPEPASPKNASEWDGLKKDWNEHLRSRVFRGWPIPRKPRGVTEVSSVEKDGIRLTIYEFVNKDEFALRLYRLQRAELKQAEINVLNVMDDQGWREFLGLARPVFAEALAGEAEVPADDEAWKSTRQMLLKFPWAMTYFAPRGVGPTAFDGSEKKQVQNRRRLYLLGQTLEGMQTLDVVTAVQACQTTPAVQTSKLWLQSERTMAGVALYAAVMQPGVARLDLYHLPAAHRNGPILLNIERKMNMPQAVALAAENSQVVLYGAEEADWKFPRQVIENLGWDGKQLQLRKAPTKEQ